MTEVCQVKPESPLAPPGSGCYANVCITAATGYSLAATKEARRLLRSFVATCQRIGVDPFAWLKDVLSRIAAPLPSWPNFCHTTGYPLRIDSTLSLSDRTGAL